MNWNCKKFEALTHKEIFEIFKARCEVFVVEQNCHYQDVDNDDLNAFHLFAMADEKLTAYCRIYSFDDKIKIGRVLITKPFRGKNYGRALMLKALDFVKQNWKNATIQIQAQVYLKNFYQSLGFKPISEEYLDAGIPHIDMILKLDSEGNKNINLTL